MFRDDFLFCFKTLIAFGVTNMADGAHLREIRVRQIMSEKLVKVPAKTTVKKVSEIMKEHRVGSILVNEGKQLVGIITETDVVQKSIAEGRNSSKTMVEAIMSFPLITVDLDARLEEVAEVMNHNGIRHLGVTEEGHIKGVVSMRDLLHPFMEFMGSLES